jgi:hypothetical protein
MAPELSISEQLTYSTVRIECEFPGGERGSGTGFFYRFLDDGTRHVPAIVTNKHVVVGATAGRFHLTLRDADGGPKRAGHTSYSFPNFERLWIDHPDPDVDLAIMPIAPLLTKAEKEGRLFFFISLDGSLVPTQKDHAEFTALEEIIMIGYPNGIWDSINNLPVLRRGVTATHPSVDYEGRREFMIDAACFPGSSGSPVFLFNVGGYTTRSGETRLGGIRVKLLGVLYAGPQHTATGEVRIVNVPTQQRAIAVSGIPNNLGLVIKSGRLAEFDAVLQRRAGS